MENIKFVNANYQPAVNEHLTPKIYVDNNIDETSLIRNKKDNDFGNFNLTNINSITLNKQAEIDNEVITKAYVDQFHEENERSRRDLGIDFYNESSDLVKNNQDNDFNDKKLINVNSITINKDPSSDNEVTKKYISMMNWTKILSLDLIKHYKIISKYLLEMINIIILKMIKYKLQIQQSSNIQTLEDIYYNNGI